MAVNETYQFLVYADYVNLLGQNVNFQRETRKSYQTLVSELGLEEKNEYMLMYCHQTAFFMTL